MVTLSPIFWTITVLMFEKSHLSNIINGITTQISSKANWFQEEGMDVDVVHLLLLELLQHECKKRKKNKKRNIMKSMKKKKYMFKYNWIILNRRWISSRKSYSLEVGILARHATHININVSNYGCTWIISSSSSLIDFV